MALGPGPGVAKPVSSGAGERGSSFLPSQVLGEPHPPRTAWSGPQRAVECNALNSVAPAGVGLHRARGTLSWEHVLCGILEAEPAQDPDGGRPGKGPAGRGTGVVAVCRTQGGAGRGFLKASVCGAQAACWARAVLTLQLPDAADRKPGLRHSGHLQERGDAEEQPPARPAGVSSRGERGAGQGGPRNKHRRVLRGGTCPVHAAGKVTGRRQRPRH